MERKAMTNVMRSSLTMQRKRYRKHQYRRKQKTATAKNVSSPNMVAAHEKKTEITETTNHVIASDEVTGPHAYGK